MVNLHSQLINQIHSYLKPKQASHLMHQAHHLQQTAVSRCLSVLYFSFILMSAFCFYPYFKCTHRLCECIYLHPTLLCSGMYTESKGGFLHKLKGRRLLILTPEAKVSIKGHHLDINHSVLRKNFSFHLNPPLWFSTFHPLIAHFSLFSAYIRGHSLEWFHMCKNMVQSLSKGYDA